MPPICEGSTVKLREFTYRITTWCSQKTQTHCLPKEACVIQCLHQTALQVLLIHTVVPSALFSLCGGGDIKAGDAGRLKKLVKRKKSSCVIGLTLDSLQAVARRRMSSSGLSRTIPPTHYTMS